MKADELFSEIRIQIHERLSSPLLGSFVISWAIWNYKLLLLIVSDLNFERKLYIIDVILYPTYRQSVIFGIAIPLLMSLTWIFVYPFPAIWTYEYYLKRKVKLKDIRDEVEKSERLTNEESNKIRIDCYERLKENGEIIHNKDSEIDTLKKVNEKLETELAQLKTTTTINVIKEKVVKENPLILKKYLQLIADNFDKEMSGKAIKILNTIDSKKEGVQDNEIVAIGIDNETYKLLISKLDSLGLLRRTAIQSALEGAKLLLTDNGKEFMYYYNKHKDESSAGLK